MKTKQDFQNTHPQVLLYVGDAPATIISPKPEWSRHLTWHARENRFLACVRHRRISRSSIIISDGTTTWLLDRRRISSSSSTAAHLGVYEYPLAVLMLLLQPSRVCCIPSASTQKRIPNERTQHPASSAGDEAFIAWLHSTKKSKKLMKRASRAASAAISWIPPAAPHTIRSPISFMTSGSNERLN